jgi:hypothetical protein
MVYLCNSSASDKRSDILPLKIPVPDDLCIVKTLLSERQEIILKIR